MKHKKNRRERPYKNIIRVFIILSTKKLTPKSTYLLNSIKKKKKSFKNIELQKNNFTKSEQKTPTKKLFSKNT